MSEVKSRFKIKNGEIEIEYEGLVKDVNERYKEAFDWLKSIPRKEREKKKEKKRKRGHGVERFGLQQLTI
jgi:heat shock protein HspQ